MPDNRNNPYHHATFLTSAAKLNQLPLDEGFEVAFAGRSNAGKSSALNSLTNSKALARVSKTPGRTQLINLFALDEHRRLADLPGYGYAKVAENVKKQWQKTMEDYIVERQCLQGVVQVMDVRHPLKAFDKMMLDWAGKTGLPIHILLSKSDKLSRNQANKALKQVSQDIINAGHEHVSIQLFSSLTKQGVEEAQAALDFWFGFES